MCRPDAVASPAMNELPHRDPLELMTVAEVAQLLKFSSRTVRKRIAVGELRAVTLGCSTRVPRVEVERYIAAGSREPSP